MARGLVSAIFAAGLGLAKSAKKIREGLSPLECGFNAARDERSPVSLRFFIFAVVFVVFDVELVLLLPVLSRLHYSIEVLVFYSCRVFALRLGLVLE